jgi:protein phosphatase
MTDPGLDPEKQVNEDACVARDLPIGHLLVVCDGMGGHVGGREASEAAIRTILEHMAAVGADGHPGASLKAAIGHAGKVVYDLGGSSANLLRPGSTVVAVLSHAGGSEVAHVGDSRGYLIRGSQIHPITRDHSMVQQMVDAGVLKPEEAIGHPDANKITRALGMSAAVEVEVRPTPLAHQKGDLFVLATDGLTDLVMPQEILSVTLQARQTRGLDFACQQLVALANSRGGHDNITVLVAEVLDCPACSEARSRTVVTDDPVPMEAVMAPASPGASGLHPTVVDDGAEPLVGQPAVEPTPTWVGDEPAERDSETEYALEALRRRKVTWLIVGTALVLFGLGLVVTSIWWAWAAAAMREAEATERWAVAYVSDPAPWILAHRDGAVRGLLARSRPGAEQTLLKPVPWEAASARRRPGVRKWFVS